MTIISRSGGSSAVASSAYTSGSKVVAAAAYRSGETLHDAKTGKTFDYRGKEDVLFSTILTPPGAPDWASDRQQLWNAVEAAEKRKDAQLARNLIASLPRELSFEENRAFVLQFAHEHFVSKGMIADIAIHDTEASDGGRNPHVHILLTMREINGDGFVARKNREWNRRDWVSELRAAWEHTQNDFLSNAGVEDRISLERYETRGIDKIPQERMGYTNWQLEQRGIATAKGDYNRWVARENMIWESVHGDFNDAHDTASGGRIRLGDMTRLYTREVIYIGATHRAQAADDRLSAYQERLMIRRRRRRRRRRDEEEAFWKQWRSTPQRIPTPEERAYNFWLRDYLDEQPTLSPQDGAHYIVRSRRYLMEQAELHRRAQFDNMARNVDNTRYRAIWQDRPRDHGSDAGHER